MFALRVSAPAGRLTVGVALCALLAAGPGEADEPAYVGAGACVRCHQGEARAWRGSHHDLAMQPAGPDTVLGSFDDAVFDYFGVKSRFFTREGGYYVDTENDRGTRSQFEFKYTFGVYPLQQYLVETERGRLQAFPVAWDTRPEQEGGQRWFHLYPDERIAPGNPLFWTGPSQNWNFMCAECHSTNLRRNYDPDTDSYATSWSEIDVSCEACHGPGSRHLQWAASGGGGAEAGLAVDLRRRGAWKIDPQTGVAVNSAPPTDTQVEACARCHSRRIVLSEEYAHGSPLATTYRPQVLLEGLYHADGQILDEVYVYGSFVQSRMHRRGVVCSDCHDPHSLELRAPGNALCGGCHQPARFDSPDHHFHEPESEAGRCVSCHMPARLYMVHDSRRDHSFRVPRPDLSERTRSPDACTGCHLGRSPQWAARAIRQRLGDRRRPDHFGVALQAARSGELDAHALLIALAGDEAQPSIARATAAAMLGPYLGPEAVQAVAVLLRDEDPLVRVNAIASLEAADPRLRAQLLPALFDDPFLMVRIEAAQAMADVPGGLIPDEYRTGFGRAIDEYIEVQQNNADRAESWANLGNLFSRLGTAPKAVPYYERALSIDPVFAPAYVNLADLYRSQERDADAERVLMRAVDRVPGAGAVWHALGLLRIRQGRREEAMELLRRAVELEPSSTRFRYVYAIGLQSSGDLKAAIAELERANASNPGDVGVLAALIDFHRRAGDASRARGFANDLVKRVPWDGNARALLDRLTP